MLTRNKMWALIKKADWLSDHDYKRIEKMFMDTLPLLDCIQLFEFIQVKAHQLDTRFHKTWLGKPGIRVSDDGWWDLRAEVVGRGEEFYRKINVKKLRQMADDRDYKENFTYCTNDIDLTHLYDFLSESTLVRSIIGMVGHGQGDRVGFCHSYLIKLLACRKELPLLMGLNPILDGLIADELKKG